MKRSFLLLSIAIFSLACTTEKKQPEFLVKVYERNFKNEQTRFAYLSEKGDTVIPYGKYSKAYSDTIKSWGIVQLNDRLIAIDPSENILFDVYKVNDKPDVIRNGVFRIIKDGKIGYANEEGTIVIAPQYECAFPFFNEKARVALHCTKASGGKILSQGSNQWFFIDSQGTPLDTK